MSFCGFLSDWSQKEVIIKGAITTEIVSFGDNEFTVNFPEQKYPIDTIKGFAALDYDNKYTWYTDANVTVGQNTISFNGFDYTITEKVPVRYKLYAVFEEDEAIYFRRLYSKNVKDKYSETFDRDLLYYDVIFEGTYEEKNYCTCVNITRGGFYSLYVFDESDRINFQITNKIDNFTVDGNVYCFDVKVKKIRNATETSLIAYEQPNEDEEPLYFPLPEQQFTDKGDFYLYHCKVEKNFISVDKPTTLHLYTKYVINGKTYFARARVANPQITKDIREFTFAEFMQENDGLKDFTIRSMEGGLQFVSVAPSVGYELVDNSIEKTIQSEDFSVTRTMFATHNITEDNKYKLHINANMSDVDDIVVFCNYPKSKEKVALEIVSWNKSTGDLVVDVSNLEGSCDDFTARSYMVCIAFLYEGLVYPAKLRNPLFRGKNTDPEIKAIDKRVFPIIDRFDVNGVEVTLAPMYFISGYLYIRVRECLLAKKDLASVKYKSLEFQGSCINISVRLPKDGRNYTGFAFTYRYKKSDDRLSYYVDGEIKKSIFGNILSASIDVSKFDLKRVIWDMYAVFEEDDRKYGASVKITRKKINRVLFDKKRVEKQVDVTVPTDEGEDVIFPYYTTINTIAFMMREKSNIDSSEFRAKEFEAYKIFRKNEKKLANQNIILIYEKFCACAQDNGYCFFKHCMEHNVEKILNAKIYYVIDKNVSDYNRVKMYDDHVLDFLSLDHMVYLLASKLLVSSDSKPHSYAWRPNNSFISEMLKKKKIFFLQHGVIALKRVDSIFGKKGGNPVNRFVVSTPLERSIIINKFGYKSSEVCMTGLSRWDELVDKSKDCNEILIMPTWRNWLDEAENTTFLQSDYYKNYSKLLESKRLNKLLEDNNLNVNFYIHPKFKDYIGNFDVTSKRMRLIPYGEEPLNELMMRCKLLITDYSSVCWDVYYMNKPILFYQFDYDLYNTVHGSYINMEKDLFGYRSLTMDKLLDDLESAIKNNFKQPKEFEDMRETTFAFTDKNNSARIVLEIKKMNIFD